jgi:hypothetical protein
MYSFPISPSQIYEEIVATAEAGNVPVFKGSPGLGKTAGVHQFGEDHNLKIIPVGLGQYAPEDLNGLPMRDGKKATFAPYDLFPLQGDPIPEGYDGWVVFLDEITSASKAVQAAAYKLIHERKVGTNTLHDSVVMVAAGNLATDKAVVNPMSTASQSRMIHYIVEVNHKESIEYFLKNDADTRVISYLSFMPSKLMDFRPDHQEHTFPCPRTWEMLSNMVKGKEITPRTGPRIAGTIGEGTAIDFMTFAREFDRLPNIQQIIDDPLNTAVPPETSTKFATVSMLTEHISEDQIEPILEYVERFDIEMQILFARAAATMHAELEHSSRPFLKFIQRMARYLG